MSVHMLAPRPEARDELRRVLRRTTARRTVVTLALLVLLSGLVVASILLGGSADIPVGEALVAAVGQGDGLAAFVVYETRVPRTLTALSAGALFGMCGAVYQRLVDNPLATPDVIGVTAGASAGAVLVLVTAGATGMAVQGAALTGALLAVALIFGLSRARTGSTYRLILVGIGVSACFASITNYQLTRADEGSSERAMRWLIGSLSGASWDDARLLAVTLVLACAAMVPFTADLENLRLGDELATGIGTRAEITRLACLLIGAVVAALVTSVAGPVAFVALVSGPIAIRLMPAGGVFAAGLIGSALLLGSDLVAQNAPLISPVPVGVVTALVGAPVLVRILIRGRSQVV